MSDDEPDGTAPGQRSVTRRRFVQGTAVLGTLSFGASEAINASSAEAAENTQGFRVAQGTPQSAARSLIAPAPLEALPAKPPNEEVSEFIRLSRVLTGFDDLKPDLATQYLQRCKENPVVKDQLKPLVQILQGLSGSRTQVEEALSEKLKSAGVDSPLFGAAEQIIYLWYVGAFFTPNGPKPGFWDYGPPEHYYRGKMWSAIGVDPPIDRPLNNRAWGNRG
jgi:Membrane bound FAD containing D-sorbitol dehydrogenase